MEHENWQKVLEFCDFSCNFTNFAPEFYKICAFLAEIYKEIKCCFVLQLGDLDPWGLGSLANQDWGYNKESTNS